MLPEQGKRMLVELIEIRPLLTVDLDVDEVLVHQGGDCGILEALVGHDVAPVARGVADRQQDWLVAGAGLGERGLVPGLPMHRVLAVLQQIGAGRLAKTIAQVGHVQLPGAWGPGSSRMRQLHRLDI